MKAAVNINRDNVAQYLSALVESCGDIIIGESLDGSIIFWNDAAANAFGYISEEIIGKNINQLVPPDRQQEEKEIIDKIKHEQRIENCETLLCAKDGSLIDLYLTISPILDKNKKLIGISKIGRNIAEKKKNEKTLALALREAEISRDIAQHANIAKTEFLANMSHEIRTPMNAVIGLANILACSTPLTDKQKSFVQTLLLSADSLLALINDLLDISKIETRSVELENIPFSLTKILQETISMMAAKVSEKGLTFTANEDVAANRIFIGDPQRIRQILLNLCSNAVKFTEQGSIHVQVRCSPGQIENIEMVSISVTDTGIGIAPDKQDMIFNKFAQADASIHRRYGGTGLGLAITKTLVEIMGGTIDLKSELNKGSNFTVCIPLPVSNNSIINVAADIKESSIAETDLDKGNILLVEDYAPNVMVAGTYLNEFGYKYDVAINGLEAIDKFKSNAYDAILMDVQMYGMNGFEATKLIREYEVQHNLRRLPIIGMTAHALAGDAERCFAIGMDGYIPKPFRLEELQETLLEVIGNKIKLKSE